MSKKLTLTSAMILAGCTNNFGNPGSLGWQSLVPPEENALGRYIERTSKGITLGGEGFIINDSNTTMSKSYDDVTKEEYEKLQITAKAKIQEVSADAGLEITSSSSTKSLGFSVVGVRDFSGGVPLEKRFIYKCLMLSEYSFEAKSKTTANLDVDASAIAEKFGVADAKVSIKKGSDQPDTLKVSVKNPNLCMSFISAKLFRSYSPFESNGASRDFFKNQSLTGEKTFTLSKDGYSAPLDPDLRGAPRDSRPTYRLYTVKSEDKLKLYIWKEQSEFPDKPKYFEMKEKTENHWFGEYGVENLYYNDNKYALIRARIEAERLPSGEIKINSASLRAPTYKLLLD